MFGREEINRGKKMRRMEIRRKEFSIMSFGRVKKGEKKWEENDFSSYVWIKKWEKRKLM